ncbi:MAG: hypothetical protein GYA41_12505 [Bacteroidales bacterium]|nr:hypothetical protein [Bacteroidales bacterium]
MINLFHTLSTIAFLYLSGCNPVNNEVKNIQGYNFNSPDAAFVLPGMLHEISGITYLGAEYLACIQDENGIIFIYDVKKNKLERQFTFYINGDYEGITSVGEKIYVLRSDGTLFEISDHESEKFDLDVFFTNIPSKDNEGLCYDPYRNRLLIAPKGQTIKGSESKDTREIYAFDLKTKTLSKDPVFEFDLQEIRDFAMEKKINLPMKEKKKGKEAEPKIDFMTSAIGINPATKKLFILSSSDHMLFIYNMAGKIEHIEMLNPMIFNNAEGISFFSNGDMVITNEGGGRSASILRFNYKKK